MKRKKRKPVVLDVERLAKRAEDVIADVDTLVAQLKKMVESQSNDYKR